MNKKILLTVSITGLIFLSSCLTSLHNLVNYKNITNDERITGTWQYGDLTLRIDDFPSSKYFSSITNTTIASGEKTLGYDSIEDSLLFSKSYIIDFIKDNYHYYMVCCLSRIGNDMFGDIQPINLEPVNKPVADDLNTLLTGATYIPSHSMAKIVFRNNEVEFRFLNGDFIKDQLENGMAAVKHETDNLFNTALITSAAGDLRQFIAKYGGDDRLYSAKNIITLKKTWQ